MVDAHDVDEFVERLKTAQPPRVSRVGEFFPVVQRIAPQLALGREIIRRNTGDISRETLGVELKQIPVTPHIDRIVRHKDGDVAHDADVAGIGHRLEGAPLTSEDELREFAQLDVGGVLLVGFGHGRRFAVAQTFGPLRPERPFGLFFLERVEKRKIVKPARVRGTERFKLSPYLAVKGAVGGQKAVEDEAQFAYFVLPRQTEVGAVPALGTRLVRKVLRRQQTDVRRAQVVQIDEARIARHRARRVVRTSAVVGRHQGQHLPDRLTRISQKLNKSPRGSPKGANPRTARQTRRMKKNSTSAHVLFVLIKK